MSISVVSKPARVLALAIPLLVLGVGCVNTETPPAIPDGAQDVEPTTACVPESNDIELHTLVVGESTGVISEPYIAWGVKERCFEKYGLKIESVAGSSQSARIAGLVGGSMDVVSQHIRFVVQAMGNSEFEPLFISAHYGFSEELLEQARNSTTFEGELIVESAIITAPNSDISNWQGLNGKKLGAINTTGRSIKGLEILTDMGLLDIDSVELIQLDQQEILNGLLRGDLDAGSLSGSLALEAISNGGTLIGYPTAFFDDPGVAMLWVANSQANEKTREALLRFQDALWEIYALLETPAYREDLLDLMEENYELEPATRAATRLPELMARQLTPEDFLALVPKMVEFGDIDAEVELTDSMFLRK